MWSSLKLTRCHASNRRQSRPRPPFAKPQSPTMLRHSFHIIELFNPSIQTNQIKLSANYYMSVRTTSFVYLQKSEFAQKCVLYYTKVRQSKILWNICRSRIIYAK